MAENVHIFDNADKVPPSPPGRHPLAPISGADFERPARRTPWQLWGLLMAVVMLPMAWLLWRVNMAMESFFMRYDWVGDVLMWLSVIGVGCVLVGVTIGVVGRVLLGVQKARVIRTRHGVPVDVIQQLRHDPVFLEHQAVVLEMLRAQYSQYPNLSTLSGATASKGEAVPALPAPEPTSLSPSSEWLGWAAEAPHLLVAGATGSGKTTLAHVLLGQRVASDAILVLDPKGKDWYGATVIGSGWDMAAIMDALGSLHTELTTRYRAYGAGERGFAPLTIVIDEVPAIVDQCRAWPQKAMRDRWPAFARQIGSLAREVNIRLLLLTQSPNVEDIGINAAMRRNFMRIGLQDEASRLIDGDERDAQRRKLLHSAIAGRPYRATMAYRGQVHALETSDIPHLSNRPMPPVRGWVLTPQPALDPREAARAARQAQLEAARAMAAQGGEDIRRGIAAELARAGYATRAIQYASMLRNEEVCAIWRDYHPNAPMQVAS